MSDRDDLIEPLDNPGELEYRHADSRNWDPTAARGRGPLCFYASLSVGFLLLVLIAALASYYAGQSHSGSSSNGDARPPAGSNGSLPSIAGYVKASEGRLGARRGFVDAYVDWQNGRVLWAVRVQEQLVLTRSVSWGLGANSAGLDRGMPLGAAALCSWQRPNVKRLLLVRENTAFLSSHPQQSTATQRFPASHHFAQSVEAAVEVLAEDAADGKVLVDATALLLVDPQGLLLKSLGNFGRFSEDLSRSWVELSSVKCSAQSLDADARLTFVASGAINPEVAGVTPSPAGTLTIGVRVSLISLVSGSDFTPLPFDVRSGYASLQATRLDAQLEEGLFRQLLVRHHLAAGRSITYYLDNAIPEPFRSAVL